MKILSLTDKETFSDDFILIAIYSDEEDYRMAFLLNQFLKIKLINSTAIITPKNKAEYAVFEYEDTTLIQLWQLLFNHSFIKKEITPTLDLFSEAIEIYEKKVYYINQLKKVRFFLKIVANENEAYYKDIVKKIKKIPQVYTAEILPLAQIKNSELLLF